MQLHFVRRYAAVFPKRASAAPDGVQQRSRQETNPMTVIKLHAAGALAALLFAAPASTFAQDASGMMMKDNQAVMTMPNGTMSDKMMMTEEMMKMALCLARSALATQWPE